MLLVAVSGQAWAQISIAVELPAPEARVHGEIFVQTTVSSAKQLATVEAGFAGEAALPMRFENGKWGVVLDSTGRPFGPLVIEIKATDIVGDSAAKSVQVRVDGLPTGTVSSPRSAIVARPDLVIAATCADDGPSPCRLVASVTRPQVYNERDLAGAAGSPSIDTRLCLADFEGRSLAYSVAAFDSSDQFTSLSRGWLVVNSSAHLKSQLTVPGLVFDLDDTRLAYRDDKNALWVKAVDDPGQGILVAQNVEFTVPTGGYSSRDVTQAWLTPVGVAFSNLATGPDGGMVLGVFHWRSGASVELAWEDQLLGHDVVQVSGDFGRLPSGDRYQFSTRERVTPPSGAIMAPSGRLYFQSGPGADLNEWFPDGGAALQGTLPGGALASEVMGEPPNLVIRVGGGVLVQEGQSFLSIPSAASTAPVLARSGWVAFEQPTGATGDLQAWVRAPDGGLTQRSFLGGPAEAEALLPNGDLIFRSAPNVEGAARRYYSAANGSEFDLGGVDALGRDLLVGLASEPRVLADGGVKVVLLGEVFDVDFADGGQQPSLECTPPPTTEEPPPPDQKPAPGCPGCGYGGQGVIGLLAFAFWLRRSRAC